MQRLSHRFGGREALERGSVRDPSERMPRDETAQISRGVDAKRLRRKNEVAPTKRAEKEKGFLAKLAVAALEAITPKKVETIELGPVALKVETLKVEQKRPDSPALPTELSHLEAYRPRRKKIEAPAKVEVAGEGYLRNALFKRGGAQPLKELLGSKKTPQPPQISALKEMAQRARKRFGALLKKMIEGTPNAPKHIDAAEDLGLSM